MYPPIHHIKDILSNWLTCDKLYIYRQRASIRTRPYLSYILLLFSVSFHPACTVDHSQYYHYLGHILSYAMGILNYYSSHQSLQFPCLTKLKYV